jgi:hypothetical protein
VSARLTEKTPLSLNVDIAAQSHCGSVLSLPISVSLATKEPAAIKSLHAQGKRNASLESITRQTEMNMPSDVGYAETI